MLLTMVWCCYDNAAKLPPHYQRISVMWCKCDSYSSLRTRHRDRRFGDDAINYAWGLARGVPGCTNEAISMLVDMRKKCEEYRQKEPGLLGQELAFQVWHSRPWLQLAVMWRSMNGGIPASLGAQTAPAVSLPSAAETGTGSLCWNCAVRWLRTAVSLSDQGHVDVCATQAVVNAAIVADAEVYYRNMLSRDELTWNLRDSHSTCGSLHSITLRWH